MSQLNVDTIKKADGTGSLTVPAETGTVVTTASPSLGRRNLIINGAMQVAQRGTSSTGVIVSGYYTLDRFEWLTVLDEVVTLNQSSESPDGFSNSFHVDVTTADTDVSGASDRVGITYAVEAQDLQQLGYGTASAQTMTLSFWVRSSVTGTYAVGFYQPDSARFYSSTYVVNSANTWEQKTITISGDASGQIDNNNGSGLTMYFWLAASSTYTSGSGDTWSASGSEWAAGHNVNVLGDAANNFYLTGVQLEVGSVATPFEHRSYGEELALCQRYYQRYELHHGYNLVGQVYSTNPDGISFDLKCDMRDEPSVVLPTIGNTAGTIGVTGDNGSYITTQGTFNVRRTVSKVTLQGSGFSGNFTGGNACMLYSSSSGIANNVIKMDAEL